MSSQIRPTSTTSTSTSKVVENCSSLTSTTTALLEGGGGGGGDEAPETTEPAGLKKQSRNRPRPALIPAGSWPRRMPVELAAGYCGERTTVDFLKRVGKDYPRPRVAEGRRRLWLRDDLDRAIAPDLAHGDLAEDL